MNPSGYKKYIVGAVLFFLVIVHLIAYNIKGKVSLNFVEKGILIVSFPVEKLVSSVTAKIAGVWNGYIYLVNTQKENIKLLEENKELRGVFDRVNEIKAENERLKSLVSFVDESPEKYISAKVLSNGPSGFYHTVIINRGFESGLRRGMAVVAKEGVIGQISFVKNNYSSVITLVDPMCAIDAVDQKNRARGILRGYARDRLTFKYLPFSEKVEVGDRVVSSGLDGVYPKGLTIGDVEKVENRKGNLFQNVLVKPVVDFSKLEEVLVHLQLPKEFDFQKK